MAEVSTKLDTRVRRKKGYPLRIGISHKNTTSYIPTKYYLEENQWNDIKKKIRSNYENSGRANTVIRDQKKEIESLVEFFKPKWDILSSRQLKNLVKQEIANSLSKEKENDSSLAKADLIVKKSIGSSTCFFKYTEKVIDSFLHQRRSVKSFENMIKSLKTYYSKDSLPFNLITKDFITEYESWYLRRFNSNGEPNSINGFNFYIKDVRRIFNLAIDDETCANVNSIIYPFGSGKKKYSVKKIKTDKRNVSPKTIEKLLNAPISANTRLWNHQNYFKFYFHNWGMNFVDIALLRVSQVKNGYLKYRRKKTMWSQNAKQFNIKLSDVCIDIVNHYSKGKAPTDLLFPILDEHIHLLADIADKEKQMQNIKRFNLLLNRKRNYHNKGMNSIAKTVGVKEHFTTYVARHSFFSIALRNGVSKSVISELAGHQNFQITEEYLAGFENEQLSNSAEKVTEVVYGTTDTRSKLSKIILTPLPGNKSQSKTNAFDFISNFLKLNPKAEYRHIIIHFFENIKCDNASLVHQYITDFISNFDSKTIVAQ